MTLVHLLAPEEVDPSGNGRLRLRDVESGEWIDRYVGDEERAAYRDRLRRHCDGWKEWCHAREINYVRSTSDRPFEDLVTVALREAGVLEG